MGRPITCVRTSSSNVLRDLLIWPQTRARLHRTCVPQPSRAQNEQILYSSEAMRNHLLRVRNAWEECQSMRDRDAIYGYLSAVYALVIWWAAEGGEVDRARLALRLHGLVRSAREGPLAAIIRCTADPAKAEKRTRSKWSPVMRYAAVCKPDSEPLGQFIKRKGGINKCIARFTQDRRGANIERETVF
jgi:hypothetical protein